MNRIVYILIVLFLPSSEISSLSRTQRCAQKIKSFFNRHLIEKIDHKEFATTSLQSISIENDNGPITIKTGWKKKYLCLKTIRRAKNQTLLDTIKIVADSTKPHHLSISTKQLDGYISGSVEYELIIPTFLAVTLKTENGTIYINDTKGTINAITHDGDITIINTKNNIHAEALTTGSIYIENAQGPITTASYCGNITIHDACNSINAHTKKGKIIVDYKNLPISSNVALETSSGNISLTLPTHSSATINSSTTHGTIVSEHYITLKPYTTQLNTLAWNKLKKEVHGTIGLGEANISLSSLYGNVKILETKTI